MIGAKMAATRLFFAVESLKWSEHGHTCLVPPDIEPMVDITVYMDVAINPGPEEKTITSHREGIVNVKPSC